MSVSRRRAQTAIETLFIVAIILTGILIIVPPYLNENRDTSLVVYVRNSASSACAYINTGVMINEAGYAPLNEIIKADNYTYHTFQLTSISMNELDSKIQVNIIITYSGSAVPEATLEANIKQYIVNDLASNTNVQLSGGKLYFGGEEVEINVDVVRK
ncbi:hypothetical protein E3E26_04045 [Thermococcus sp. LS1]|uniref:hypothetical protein n=1 Tax=Thermococcus sp. LS1 TaxID=1638259 RepID=UPI00143CABEC|nr:hypothetical protein [Thermococcus sp. LS1]NJD98960.1 hypothetical protein [Thermococcus sp. LS1]